MKKFEEFLSIARKLNYIHIVPLLLGSCGLEYLTGKDFGSEDIDVNVPGDPRGWEAPDETRIYHWNLIEVTMEEIGYQLQDMHEHSFNNGIYNVEFGTMNSLPDFANIELKDLVKQNYRGISFLIPTFEQYLKIDYLKSIID